MSITASSQPEPGANLAIDRPALAPARAPIHKSPDKTTDAALRYLLTGEPDAWDHLIAILFKAKGNLFLPEPALQLRTATKRFLELWLTKKLAGYREADADTICAAAQNG